MMNVRLIILKVLLLSTIILTVSSCSKELDTLADKTYTVKGAKLKMECENIETGLYKCSSSLLGDEIVKCIEGTIGIKNGNITFDITYIERSGDGQEIFLEKSANNLFVSSGNTRPLSDFDIYDDPLHEKRLIAKNDGPCDVSLIISD